MDKELQKGRGKAPQSINSSSEQSSNKKKPNKTGIPDNMKAHIEYMSQVSLDAVRVHYNSDKPASVGANAYAEYPNVYIAPEREDALGEELWHIVQQMKGEVTANTQFGEGTPGNDEQQLEEEARKKGEEASPQIVAPPVQEQPLQEGASNVGVIQRQPIPDEEGDPIGKGTVEGVELLALRSTPSIPEGDRFGNILADVKSGTVLTVIKDAGNGFYEVEVAVNGERTKGYMGKAYITLMQFPEKYSSFDEEALKAQSATLENRLSTNYVAYDPSNLDWNISDEDVEAVLTQIQAHYDTLTLQEFTILMMYFKQSGKLDVLFEQLDQQHMINHFELLIKIAVYISPDKAISIAQMQLIEEISEVAIKEGLRAAFRYPTLDNPNPIDVENFKDLDKEALKEGVKSQLEILLEENNQQQIINDIDKNVRDIMELKTAEIRYHLEKGNIEELRQQLIEIDKLADASLELLFSDNPQNEYLTKTIFYPLIPLWDELKSEPESGTVYPFGFQDGRKLEDVFDTQTQQIKSPQENTTTTTSNTSSGGSKKNTTAPKPKASKPATKPLSTLAKTFIKELIVKEAETVHQFFYKDIVELGYEYEEMVPTINKIIDEDLKPNAYQKLRAKGVEMNDETNTRNINTSKIDWMDLVRIWYYELGNQNLGTKDNKLKFGANDATTQAIRNHVTIQNLVNYAKARAAQGDYSTIKPFVHYDVSGFYKAIASKDTTFNLLGSFTMIVEPNASDRSIKFTIINTSGKESATRFRRDNTRKGVNKVGVFEDTERGAEGIPNLGGNLHCEWTWTESF